MKTEDKRKQEEKENVKNEPNVKKKIKNEHNVCASVKCQNKFNYDKDDFFPTLPSPNKKLNKVAYVVIDREEMNTAYQDLTSRFPIWSARGNEYIIIGYHYNANCILGHPVQDKMAGSLTKAWEHLH